MHIKKLNNEQLCYASHTSSFLSPGRTVGVCPPCVKVAAWVVMGCIHCFFWCRKISRPLAERIPLKSSDFDDVCLSHSLPTRSPPTVFFLSLPASHSFVCLPAFHMLSLSLCLNSYLYGISLSLSVCHTVPSSWFCSSWPGPCVGVFADVHHHKLRPAHWRQWARDGNKIRHRLMSIAWQRCATVNVTSIIDEQHLHRCCTEQLPWSKHRIMKLRPVNLCSW